MKPTNEQAILALQALGQLDGYDRVVKQADGSERVVRQHYRFGTAARLAMARAIVKLKPVAEAYAAAREGALKQHSDGKGFLADTPEDAAKVIAFKAADRELLAAEADVAVEPFALTALELDQNPIPPSVLALLMPILTE